MNNQIKELIKNAIRILCESEHYGSARNLFNDIVAECDNYIRPVLRMEHLTEYCERERLSLVDILSETKEFNELATYFAIEEGDFGRLNVKCLEQEDLFQYMEQFFEGKVSFTTPDDYALECIKRYMLW